MSKVLRKLGILAVMLFALTFVVMNNSTPVSAAPCCSECDANAAYCDQLCDWANPNGDPNCPYKYLYQCYQDMGVYSCWAHCVMSC